MKGINKMINLCKFKTDQGKKDIVEVTFPKLGGLPTIGNVSPYNVVCSIPQGVKVEDWVKFPYVSIYECEDYNSSWLETPDTQEKEKIYAKIKEGMKNKDELETDFGALVKYDNWISVFQDKSNEVI